MLDHVSMQCGDVAASAVFYDAFLAPLGGVRIISCSAVSANSTAAMYRR